MTENNDIKSNKFHKKIIMAIQSGNFKSFKAIAQFWDKDYNEAKYYKHGKELMKQGNIERGQDGFFILTEKSFEPPEGIKKEPLEKLSKEPEMKEFIAQNKDKLLELTHPKKTKPKNPFEVLQLLQSLKGSKNRRLFKLAQKHGAISKNITIKKQKKE